MNILLLGLIISSAATLLLAGSWLSYTSTFDTATVGLMSVNILGGDRPLFFYGQPYFGALEAYVAALFLSIFGFSEFVISFSPISFTLGWILFSYLLFTRIHNRTAGIVAATCVAFPGYYVFWYSIATYGGYSAILCIGTAILWLSLRILQENPKKVALLLQSISLGLLIGLGIWIHPLTFPYIAVSAGTLVVYTIRERFRLGIILCLGSAALIGLCGFLPFYLETGSFYGGVSESVKISWTGVRHAFTNLFAVNIHELVVWNFTHVFESATVKFIILYGSFPLLLSAVLFSFGGLFKFKQKTVKKSYYLIPFTFCLLFLLMYVQHHMASVKAPRYAINFWSMLLCIIWTLAISAQKKRALKIVACTLFCVWIAYQVVGTVYFIVGNTSGAQEEQKRIQAVVDAARENNLRSVVIIGDTSLGYKAQKFSMFAENKIVFANADAERYSANAQFSETDSCRGYLTNADFKISLQNTLEDLGVSFTVNPIAGFFLFSDIVVRQQYAMHVVSTTEIQDVSEQKIENDEFTQYLLLDGNQDTGLKRKDYPKVPLILDTGKLRSLCALWMFTYQNGSITPWNRPGQYEVHVSGDGVQYEKVYSSPVEAVNGFHAGDLVFIGGPWGKIETTFPPVSARYIKIIFLDKKTSPVTELFVFETKGEMRQEHPDDIKKIQEIITEEGITFVLADRWLSASLLKAFKGYENPEIALPRHSTKYNNKPLRYFVRGAKGQAIVCDKAVADMCEQILTSQYRETSVSNRFDLQNYTLFSLNDSGISNILKDRSALLWNGHVPLQTRDMTLLAPWFHSLGLPVWKADYIKTTGIFHDGWTNGNGRFTDLNHTVRRGEERELVLYTNGWRGNVDISDLQLAVIVNETFSLKFKEKIQDAYVFYLPDALSKLDNLEIHSTTFVPPGLDSRSLGIDIKRIELQ